LKYAAAHRVAGPISLMKALTTAGIPLFLSITVLIGGAMLAWMTEVGNRYWFSLSSGLAHLSPEPATPTPD